MREPIEVLINEYQRNLFAAAFSVCKNAEDANDVVQETFIQYYTSKKEFEDEQHLKAWLIRAAADSAYAKDLNCTFIKAEVIQTALGTYVDIFFKREEGLWEEELALTMADARGGRTGGFILDTEDEGIYRARIKTGKMEIGDSFDAAVYDIENHKELQIISFTKQK